MLLVGDKVGDVYGVPVPDVSAGRRMLFGHTATMITDCVRDWLAVRRARGLQLAVACVHEHLT